LSLKKINILCYSVLKHRILIFIHNKVDVIFFLTRHTYYTV